MKHTVKREFRRSFCSDDYCNGQHREPFAVCSCGWAAWAGDYSIGAEEAEQRRVYQATKDEHLREVTA